MRQSTYVMYDLSFFCRNIYYIKKNEDDEWIPGTIIGNREARIISFAEDNDVRFNT